MKWLASIFTTKCIGLTGICIYICSWIYYIVVGFVLFMLFSFVLCCPLQFPSNYDIRVIFTALCFGRGNVLFMLFVRVFIYVNWCSQRFPYHIIFSSFNSDIIHFTYSSNGSPFRTTRVLPSLGGSYCSIVTFLCCVL